MRFFITFAYDGSKYSGYQKQPKQKTIQGELEKALKQINDGKEVSLVASGRTDAGVHAYNQRAHFDLETKITPEKFKWVGSEERWERISDTKKNKKKTRK